MHNDGVPGISPEMMELGGTMINGDSNSLLDKLYQISGVSRVDSHTQTVALCTFTWRTKNKKISVGK